MTTSRSVNGGNQSIGCRVILGVNGQMAIGKLLEKFLNARYRLHAVDAGPSNC